MKKKGFKPQRKPKKKGFKQIELVDQGGDDETQDCETAGPEAATNKTTALQAYITIVRASLGPGCLSLPYAFASAGTVLGPSLLTIISAVTLFNVHSLVACRAFLQQKHAGARVKTYGDLGYFALGGKYGRATVEVLLVFMELGICTVYFEFISTNLAVVLPPMIEDDDPLLEGDEGGDAADRRLLMMLIFPFLTMLAWIRHMKQLAPFSMAANVFMFFGIIIVLGFAFHNVSERGWAQGLPASKIDTVPLFYGTVIYSFEGCGAVLPVENSMRDPGESWVAIVAALLFSISSQSPHPRSLHPIPALANALFLAAQFRGVVNWAFCTFYIFFMSVGLFCYLSFSSITSSSITAAIGTYYQGTLVKAVNLLVAVAVGLTYPVQFYAAVEVLEDHVGLGNNAHQQHAPIRPRAHSSPKNAPHRNSPLGPEEDAAEDTAEDTVEWEAGETTGSTGDMSTGDMSSSEAPVAEGGGCSLWGLTELDLKRRAFRTGDLIMPCHLMLIPPHNVAACSSHLLQYWWQRRVCVLLPSPTSASSSLSSGPSTAPC
jgi:amino acid permease